MPHELVHGVTQVGGGVSEGVGGPTPPHGRQVVRREQHLEQPLERFALHESFETSGVQTEGGEDVREAGEDLAVRALETARHVVTIGSRSGSGHPDLSSSRYVLD